MANLETREKARSLILGHNLTLLPEHKCGPRALAWAHAILGAPLDFATLADLIGDAEAQCELSLSDGTVAEIADRTFRGEGITVQYFTRLDTEHRIVIDGESSPWMDFRRPVRVGNIMAVGYKMRGPALYRVIPLDLATIEPHPGENP